MLPLLYFSIKPRRKEVIVTSLVVGVVAGIIGNYIYDKYIR